MKNQSNGSGTAMEQTEKTKSSEFSANAQLDYINSKPKKMPSSDNGVNSNFKGSR